MLKIKQTATIEIDQIKIQNAKLWEIGAKKETNEGAAELGGGFDSDDEDQIQVEGPDINTNTGFERAGSWITNIFTRSESLVTP